MSIYERMYLTILQGRDQMLFLFLLGSAVLVLGYFLVERIVKQLDLFYLVAVFALVVCMLVVVYLGGI